MIPIRLSIKGMYSYRSEQSIDFTPLTKNHLFGIFGPVGSGKSTILEAISFALYNETERLNSRDARAYNMMNLKSDEMVIDFEFRAGEKNAERFRFTVKGIRDKKDFSKVPKLERRAFKHDGTDWDPLDPRGAAEIIGLNYENFRRTIIIPQGKFQEFLQLGDADRTTMMKEIFNLSRYDLSRKTEAVDKRNSVQLARLQGQLLQVGEVDADLIARETSDWDAFAEQRFERGRSLTGLEEREKDLQNTKALLARVAAAEQTRRELTAQEPRFRERKVFLEQYEQCQRQFPDMLNQRREAREELAESEKRLRQYSLDLDAVKARIHDAGIAFEQVHRQHEGRQDLRLRGNELMSIAGILKLDDDLRTGQSSLSALERSVKTQADQIEKLKSQIGALEEELKRIKANAPDEKALMEIKRWTDRHSMLEEEIARLERSREQQRLLLSSVEERKLSVFGKRPASDHLQVETRSWPLDRIINILHDTGSECRSAAERKEAEADALRHTAVLENFAQGLKDGEPCPLCGATSHPQIYASTGVKAHLQVLAKEKRDLIATADALQATVQDLRALHAEQTMTVTRVAEMGKELQDKQRVLVAHQQSASWTQAELDKTDSELERAEAVRTRVKSLEKQAETQRNSLRTLEASFAGLTQSCQTLDKSISASKGKRLGLTENLHLFSEGDISRWTLPSIAQEIKSLKEQLARIESTFAALDAQLQTDRKRLGSLEGSMTTEGDRKEKAAERLSRIEVELRQRLERSGYSDLAHIERILASGLNAREERSAISEYYSLVTAAEHQLALLRGEAERATYDESEHRAVLEGIASTKRELEHLDQEIGRLKNHIQELERRLEAKRSLEEQFKELELRADDLATLKSLFRASGFVNFASRIHLRNLCGIANQRFMQLTRQKLKLELTDDNAFAVRDFLNDGKLRSVKTLSGGQTFQASLSLALALADSLQQLARTEQNFFFLDEGFGSLDKDSLQVVFDALKSLRRDNRVVGVISHVEEMQQEIENSVVARLDPEKGTILECN